jgi:hypothetical protein
MKLELDEKEQKVLTLVLKSFDAELKDEIGRTDSRDYKAELRGEDEVIKKLMAKIAA